MSAFHSLSLVVVGGISTGLEIASNETGRRVQNGRFW